MRNVSDLSLKPVEWIGSSLNDLKDFPDEVQQVVGYLRSCTIQEKGLQKEQKCEKKGVVVN